MKIIIQFAVAAVLVHAAVRAGESAWRHYTFKDAVEQEVRFGDMRTISDLRRRVLQLAGDHSIQLADDDLIIEPRGLDSYVSVSYMEPIPLVPSAYTRNHAYEFALSVQPFRPLIDDRKPSR
jgi:hypothetical protein